MPTDRAVTYSTYKDVRQLTITTDSLQTSQILNSTRDKSATLEEVFLTALLATYNAHVGITSLWIGLESHGRDGIRGNIDVSQTIGWFTTIFPLRLSMPSQLQGAALIALIREQLRSVPDQGIGFGLLRYLSSEEMAAALNKNVMDITFNYLGNFDKGMQDKKWLSAAKESSGANIGSEVVFGPAIELVIKVVNQQLIMHWNYNSQKYDEATVNHLAIQFECNVIMVAQCCKDIDNYSPAIPAHFGLAGEVSWSELRNLDTNQSTSEEMEDLIKF